MYLNIDKDFRSPKESITFSSSIKACIAYKRNITNISIGVNCIHSRSRFELHFSPNLIFDNLVNAAAPRIISFLN